MNKNQEEFEKIEKHLLHKVDENDTFSQKVENDKQLKEDVDLHCVFISGIKNAGIRELIRNIHLKHTKAKNENTFKQFPGWAFGIAASVTLLALIITGYFLFYGEDQSNNTLFAKYLTPYPDAISLRGERSGEVEQAMNLYASGSYEEAVTYFSGIPDQNIYYEDTRFYLSICLLSINETEKAIDILSQLCNNNQNRFFPQIRWYLALAYLKNNQSQKCIELLDQIAEEEYKYSEAKGLIDKLSN